MISFNHDVVIGYGIGRNGSKYLNKLRKVGERSANGVSGD